VIKFWLFSSTFKKLLFLTVAFGKILINKLECIGISGVALKLFLIVRQNGMYIYVKMVNSKK